MTFDDLPGGTRVFIDANCLVYAATAHPQYGMACQRLLDDLQAIPIPILPVTGDLVSLALDFSRLHGLLTNDALIVAMMHAHGLTHLASLDADFDQVPGITRFSPV